MAIQVCLRREVLLGVPCYKNLRSIFNVNSLFKDNGENELLNVLYIGGLTNIKLSLEYGLYEMD